ncbi:DUF2975 domain-containing protein [Lacticaseibacillus sp. GG6-2]
MKVRTLLLKLMLVLAGVVVAFFGIAGFWRLGPKLAEIYQHALWAWVFIAGGYIAWICFYVAVVQAWRLLRRVDTDTAFSPLAVANLRALKLAVAGITIGLAAILPQIYIAAQQEDAPGLCLMGAGIVAVPLMVTIFLAVLERLWATALAYKQENELTV